MPRGRGRVRLRDQRELLAKTTASATSVIRGVTRGRRGRRRGSTRGRKPNIPLIDLETSEEKSVSEAQKKTSDSMGILRQNDVEPLLKKRRILEKETDPNDAKNNLSQTLVSQDFNSQYSKPITPTGHDPSFIKSSETLENSGNDSCKEPNNNDKSEKDTDNTTDILARAWSTVGIDENDISGLPDQPTPTLAYNEMHHKKSPYQMHPHYYYPQMNPMQHGNRYTHPHYIPNSSNSNVMYGPNIRSQMSREGVPVYPPNGSYMHHDPRNIQHRPGGYHHMNYPRYPKYHQPHPQHPPINSPSGHMEIVPRSDELSYHNQTPSYKNEYYSQSYNRNSSTHYPPRSVPLPHQPPNPVRESQTHSSGPYSPYMYDPYKRPDNPFGDPRYMTDKLRLATEKERRDYVLAHQRSTKLLPTSNKSQFHSNYTSTQNIPKSTVPDSRIITLPDGTQRYDLNTSYGESSSTSQIPSNTLQNNSRSRTRAEILSPNSSERRIIPPISLSSQNPPHYPITYNNYNDSHAMQTNIHRPTSYQPELSRNQQTYNNPNIHETNAKFISPHSNYRSQNPQTHAYIQRSQNPTPPNQQHIDPSLMQTDNTNVLHHNRQYPMKVDQQSHPNQNYPMYPESNQNMSPTSSSQCTNNVIKTAESCVVACNVEEKSTLMEVKEVKIDKVLNPALANYQNTYQDMPHIQSTPQTMTENSTYSQSSSCMFEKNGQNTLPPNPHFSNDAAHSLVKIPPVHGFQKDLNNSLHNTLDHRLFLPSTSKNFKSRPASEPPVNSSPVHQSSYINRPASLPPRVADLISYSSESNNQLTNIFLEQLSPLLDHLLTFPDASQLRHLRMYPDKLLSEVVNKFGGTQSTSKDCGQRLKENFSEVVRLCISPEDLTSMGWDNKTPDQILSDLIQQVKPKDDSANHLSPSAQVNNSVNHLPSSATTSNSTNHLPTSADPNNSTNHLSASIAANISPNHDPVPETCNNLTTQAPLISSDPTQGPGNSSSSPFTEATFM